MLLLDINFEDIGVHLPVLVVIVDDQPLPHLGWEDVVEGFSDLGLGDQGGEVLDFEVLFVNPLLQILHVIRQLLGIG